MLVQHCMEVTKPRSIVLVVAASERTILDRLFHPKEGQGRGPFSLPRGERRVPFLSPPQDAVIALKMKVTILE